VADEDRQVRVHEIVVPEHGPRVQEGAYDVSLVVDTSPPTRWEPTLAKIAEPELKRSAYDASLVVDTTPPTRWEPTAETGGESANSGAAGGDTASDGGPIAVKASLTVGAGLLAPFGRHRPGRLRGPGLRHLWRRVHSRRVLGPHSRCYAPARRGRTPWAVSWTASAGSDEIRYYGAIRLPTLVHLRRTTLCFLSGPSSDQPGGRGWDLPVLALGSSVHAMVLRPRGVHR
jgi:hypothetical protein